MYTGVLYHNYIINFYISIGYPIGPPSKLYENNKSTIKLLFLADSITPQSRPINILITDLHDHFLCRTFYMVDIGSNPMEAKVLNILFTAQSAPFSTLHQAPTITNSFALTYSMYLIAVKLILMIIQKGNNYVYNFLNCHLLGKLYHAISRKHAGGNNSHYND